jgi:hypothetical protein
LVVNEEQVGVEDNINDINDNDDINVFMVKRNREK